MINWIQPYATDKNIGREYNRMISLLPNDEWVGIVDHDAMFLRPDSKAQIEEVIKKHGNEFAVFGVLTNRLWGQHQQYQQAFSNDPDIGNHIEKAAIAHDNHYAEIIETHINVAGLCMVFRKRTWLEVGGFKENSILLDKEFTDDVMADGGRLAICQGVYMFHLYRWGHERPGQYIEHLKK